MAAINFPSSPTQGQSYTENGQTWYYDGVKWVSGGTFGQSALTPMYQQGVWTPVPSRGSIAAALTPTRWIWSRIGNTVTVSAFVADFTDTSTNAISISGIPYSATNVVSGAATSSRIATTNGGITLCFVRGGIDNEIQFLCTANSKTSPWIQPQYADTTVSSNSTYFTVTYPTDDTTWTPINGATVL
jgi:hypothetical protein